MNEQPPPPDPFELLKKIWAPMGLPIPAMVAPLLDVNEIDKRIADLRSVENWLSMNLNVLRMSIQGLEMQKATLAAFQAMQPQPAAAPAPKAEASAQQDPTPKTADAWWALLQQQTERAPEPQREK